MQLELRRVGCLSGSVDGDWSESSQRALATFNKHAGLNLDTKKASLDSLQVIRARSGRVCPLVCESGYRADGNKCVAIACPSGQVVGASGKCEKRPAKATAQQSEQRRPTARLGESDAGKIFCGRHGCDTVRPGCRIIPSRNNLRASEVVCDQK